MKIRAYSASGHVVLRQGTIPRGTRVLLTCDVEGLPEGNVVISYKWSHNKCVDMKCEIREGDPYYTAVNDTLLVDTTSWGGRRRHRCAVEYHSEERVSGTETGFTALVSLTG